MLKITNTLTGTKQEFVPHKQGEVKMYVCGITPYDYSHLGHGRCYVTFDLLYRLLKFLELDVTYARNFTDIDDKLLKKAKDELGDEQRYKELADKFIKTYHEDMAALNCLSPDHEPRVTETIPAIIDFIQGLIDAGKAYAVGGDVYYSVRSFDEYGKLSKRKLDDLKSGARVAVSDIKKDPLDFALWKGERQGTFWKSPWGHGRPGWHIECSVMATTFLDPHIDLHGGGMDLIFPHHENEIAQSEGLHGAPFAKYWMHNAFVRINQEKMSKSLGNFFTLREIFKQFDPMVIRFYILSHQYRAPLDFTFDDLRSMRTAYQRLAKTFAQFDCAPVDDEQLMKSAVVQKMLAFLLDDLNTSGMFGVLHESLSELQKDIPQLCAVKTFINKVLGLPFEPLTEEVVEITPEIQQLIDERDAARKAKDWARSDAIRDQLVAMGVTLQDKKLK